MRHAVVDHVLVDLVGEQQHIGRRDDLGQPAHVVRVPDRAGRVVRRVEHDQARARRDGGGQLVERNAVVGRLQRDRHRLAAGQLDRRQVAVVGRLEDDHLVARMHAAQHRRQQRLRGARGDGDLALGVVGVAVQRGDLGGDRLAQRRHAGHRRVLVEAGAHGIRHGVDDARVAIEIRKALAQVDGLLLRGQRRHHGEDGGPDLRQPRRWRGDGRERVSGRGGPGSGSSGHGEGDRGAQAKTV